MIVSVPDEKLYECPSPGKWSVGELLAHFADAEIVSTWRYRQMIENDGSPLPGYNQELWQKLGDYPSRRPEESLTLFRLMREANLRMFVQLTPAEWQRNGIHAERGPMTVRDLAVQIAGHDLNHLEQIRKILGELPPGVVEIEPGWTAGDLELKMFGGPARTFLSQAGGSDGCRPPWRAVQPDWLCKAVVDSNQQCQEISQVAGCGRSSSWRTNPEKRLRIFLSFPRLSPLEAAGVTDKS
jgi:DinB superfamily